MLAEISVEQFQEWLAFFHIREEEREKARTGGKVEPGKTPDHKTLQHKITTAMKGYQRRQMRNQ